MSAGLQAAVGDLGVFGDRLDEEPVALVAGGGDSERAGTGEGVEQQFTGMRRWEFGTLVLLLTLAVPASIFATAIFLLRDIVWRPNVPVARAVSARPDIDAGEAMPSVSALPPISR